MITELYWKSNVSILVLMELCIKTKRSSSYNSNLFRVSILVLMELCIKTFLFLIAIKTLSGFNPCFNGTMYKNISDRGNQLFTFRFNPCFNGTMYKNLSFYLSATHII